MTLGASLKTLSQNLLVLLRYKYIKRHILEAIFFGGLDKSAQFAHVKKNYLNYVCYEHLKYYF